MAAKIRRKKLREKSKKPQGAGLDAEQVISKLELKEIVKELDGVFEKMEIEDPMGLVGQFDQKVNIMMKKIPVEDTMKKTMFHKLEERIQDNIGRLFIYESGAPWLSDLLKEITYYRVNYKMPSSKRIAELMITNEKLDAIVKEHMEKKRTLKKPIKVKHPRRY